MARHNRASNLESRSVRLKLPVAKKPVFTRIADGVGLGYRRNQTAGLWVVRVADGKGKNWTKGIAAADDFEDANGGSVLDFWQAQDRARVIARVGKDRDGDDGKLVTVKQALDRYETDLKARGGDLANVARVRLHLSDTLATKTVALLTPRDLRTWRDGLTKKELAPASINRSSAAFKSALNAAASLDERIVNQRAWKQGLAIIPDAAQARNVVLPENHVLKIIDGAYEVSEEFGYFVETAATTGARPSQLGRLIIQDAQGDRTDPRLMMPSSRKGRGRKAITHRPVPVLAGLIARLLLARGNQPVHAPLLAKRSGDEWRQSDHTRLFARAVKNAGLNPIEITIYALRHTSIVRQLLKGVPTRIVAAGHDTSVAMIEKNYSRYITDHSDAITRAVLLDTTARPSATNVIPLARAAS